MPALGSVIGSWKMPSATNVGCGCLKNWRSGAHAGADRADCRLDSGRRAARQQSPRAPESAVVPSGTAGRTCGARESRQRCHHARSAARARRPLAREDHVKSVDQNHGSAARWTHRAVNLATSVRRPQPGIHFSSGRPSDFRPARSSTACQRMPLLDYWDFSLEFLRSDESFRKSSDSRVDLLP